MSQNAEPMSMKQFFEQELPGQFAAQIAANPPEDLEGEEYRLNYQVENEKYGLLVRNGTRLEVVPGGVADPHLDITLTPSTMSDVMTGGLKPGDPLLAYNNRQKLDKIKTFDSEVIVIEQKIIPIGITYKEKLFKRINFI